MKKTLVSLVPAACVLCGSVKAQPIPRFDLVLTENSSQSLDVTVNGSPASVSLVSPDNWLVGWGQASEPTAPITLAFSEPDAKGWNVVVLNGTSISVSSDRPLPSPFNAAMGNDDMFFGSAPLNNNPPSNDHNWYQSPWAYISLAFHDRGDVEHPVPDEGVPWLLLSIALTGLAITNWLVFANRPAQVVGVS
jgi:hypothetical protein